MKKKVLFYYPRFIDRYKELPEKKIPEVIVSILLSKGG